MRSWTSVVGGLLFGVLFAGTFWLDGEYGPLGAAATAVFTGLFFGAGWYLVFPRTFPQAQQASTTAGAARRRMGSSYCFTHALIWFALAAPAFWRLGDDGGWTSWIDLALAVVGPFLVIGFLAAGLVRHRAGLRGWLPEGPPT